MVEAKTSSNISMEAAASETMQYAEAATVIVEESKRPVATVPTQSIGQINDEFVLKKFLGEGKTSKVYLADQTLADGTVREVAIKSLKFKNRSERDKALKYLDDEARPLTQLPYHDNIMKLYGVCNEEGVYTNRSGKQKPAIFAV